MESGGETSEPESPVDEKPQRRDSAVVVELQKRIEELKFSERKHRRRANSFKDSVKLQRQLELAKKDVERFEIKVDQERALRRQVEKKVEEYRDDILMYQDQLNETEIAIQSVTENYDKLEDEKSVLKREFSRMQNENFGWFREMKKLEKEVELKDGQLKIYTDQILRLKKTNDDLKRRVTNDGGIDMIPAFKERMEEKENEYTSALNQLNFNLKENKGELTKVMDKLEQYKISYKNLEKKFRMEKKSSSTLAKKLEDKNTEIFILKKKNEDLLKKRKEITELRIKKHAAERESLNLKGELNRLKSKKEFQEEIVKQFEVVIRENNDMKKEITLLQEQYHVLQNQYREEKEKLDLEPIFRRLEKKDHQIQSFLLKIKQTIKALESNLVCMHCMKKFTAASVCIPCGHVFCSHCIREMVTVIQSNKRDFYKELYGLHSPSSSSYLSQMMQNPLKQDEENTNDHNDYYYDDEEKEHREKKKKLADNETEVIICAECQKHVIQTIYIPCLDNVGSKLEFVKENLEDCIQLSKRVVLPKLQLEEIKERYRQFTLKLESKRIIGSSTINNNNEE